MDTGAILRTDLFSTEQGEALPSLLVQNLERFTRQHYLIQDAMQFNEAVLGAGKPGDLAVFYGHHDRIIGFMRIYRQLFCVDARDYIVFLGGTYHDQRLNICYSAAKIGLIQAMKYKLSHPEQELVFFSNVNTPTKYQFLSTMSEIYYPRPQKPVPGPILQLVNKLKAYNHWQSAAHHPMVITNQLAVLHPDLPLIEQNELTDYYHSINPEYRKGHSLLVYLPLNLATIGHGIRQVVTNSPHLMSSDSC
ncbi:hypothetical protein [Legionella taurinensis]|uniref:GNAT family N-acetyltransferase n=1 Tax=Legionella taurinensis TaxID=70611 RepID=A0A3A5LKI2_9GAMM|nr:hypothetical protein [Legionella taurinensis]RJT48716.1 hypothetical protein D6J04_03010 [Legionella taurinensis]RJT69706.1 hypothetical protein D6J03_00815 [Legionella taurinensis]STY24932.1 Uncharacterised protein [Legionella taurinensis]